MRRLAPLAAALALACGAHVAAAGRPAIETGSGLSDAGRIERGADLFAERGCTACHTLGSGPLVGPDLSGIADRRERDWIVAMISRPDSMLERDPVARRVGSEYAARMPRLGIEPAEAVALAAFLAAAPEGGETGVPGRHCPRCARGHRRGRGHRAGAV